MFSSTRDERDFRHYANSHKNPLNRALHALCAPLFLFGLIGLLWVAPEPHWLARIPWLNWGGLALLALLPFYARISRRCLLLGTSFGVLCGMGWQIAEHMVLQPLWPFAALLVGVCAGLQMAGTLLESRPTDSRRRLLGAILVGPLWGIIQLPLLFRIAKPRDDDRP